MNEESKDRAVPLKQLQTDPVSRQQMVMRDNAAMSPFASISNFENAQRMAKVLCGSNLVPSTYRGADAIGDCVIALGMANRMGCDPVMVMQNLYVVHGRPAWSGQFVIAAINQSGRFAEPLHFIEVGTQGQDDWGFYAETTANNTGKIVKGPTITISLAKAEGWYQKNAKWKNMPEMMLRYRAGSWFGRTECPEILMGFQSREEVVDAIEFDPETGEIIGDDPVVEKQPVKVETLKKTKAPVEPIEGKKVEPEKSVTVDVATKDGVGDAVVVTGTTQTDAGMKADIAEKGWYEDGNRRFNVHGEIWDTNKHAVGKGNVPIINYDGHYRVRRGGPVAGAEIETTETVATTDSETAQDTGAEKETHKSTTPGYEEELEFIEKDEEKTDSAFDDWSEGLE